MNIEIEPQSVNGTLHLPPDKAIAQRAVLLAAAATGKTVIRNWPDAQDCGFAHALIRQLGTCTRLDEANRILEVTGKGGDWSIPAEPLNCGESGTTFRLAAGLLAGYPGRFELSAAPSLLKRPMKRIVDPLTQMGAKISGIQRDKEVYPPLILDNREKLSGIHYRPPMASAQVKSAVMLAGINAQSDTQVTELRATRDHTERMFRLFGLEVTVEGLTVMVRPGMLKSPGVMTIPGDISSAAFFIVAAACTPNSQVTIRSVGLNPSRSAFLSILGRMGANIETGLNEDAWEPSGDLTVSASTLQGIQLEEEEVAGVIDELPILMVAATQAQTPSRFCRLKELRVKETDRIESMVAGLTAMGAQIRVLDDDTVEIEPNQLNGATVRSFNDHRTVMSLAVAGLNARGTTRLSGAECVAKSFPDFFERLRSITGISGV